jgi:hypothetical protein
MFPLSPPTDSLYKFISLFGLAIFILASYKSGKAFEKISNNRVAIETVKKDIRLTIAHHDINSHTHAGDTLGEAVAIAMIKQLPDDADAILHEIESLRLPLKTRLSFDGEIRKLKTQRESLNISIIEYMATLATGILLMVLGFILWYKRDQVLKDRLLKAELEKKIHRHKEEMMVPGIPVL